MMILYQLKSTNRQLWISQLIAQKPRSNVSNIPDPKTLKVILITCDKLIFKTFKKNNTRLNHHGLSRV